MKPAARVAIALTFLSATVLAADDSTRAALEKVVDGGQRSAAHKERDRYRHPVETLLFFGLRPDMTVVELYPGAAMKMLIERAGPTISHDAHTT